MACTQRMRDAAIKRRREAALKALEAQLKAKTARIMRQGNHVSIEGWTDRSGWCDACAINALRQSTDMEARRLATLAAPVGQALTFGHGH